MIFLALIVLSIEFHNVLIQSPECARKRESALLARHNELPEDDIFETCRSMLFVIIVFDIIVQSLVKL